jgi:hypothetical protein
MQIIYITSKPSPEARRHRAYATRQCSNPRAPCSKAHCARKAQDVRILLAVKCHLIPMFDESQVPTSHDTTLYK